MPSFIFDAGQGGAPVYSNNRQAIVSALTAKPQASGAASGIAYRPDAMSQIRQNKWNGISSDMGSWRTGVSAASPFPRSQGLLFDVGRFLSQRQIPGGMY